MRNILTIKMVRLIGIASLLLLSHVSLVAAVGMIPLLPGGGLIPRAGCRGKSYGI